MRGRHPDPVAEPELLTLKPEPVPTEPVLAGPVLAGPVLTKLVLSRAVADAT